MSRVAEIAYLGRDNAIDLQLKADGEVVDLSSVTQIDLVERDSAWSVSSATSPSVFDWSAGDGVLSLVLGEESIPEGAYRCYLVIYDPTNTDGIVWDDFRLTVKEV